MSFAYKIVCCYVYARSEENNQFFVKKRHFSFSQPLYADNEEKRFLSLPQSSPRRSIRFSNLRVPELSSSQISSDDCSYENSMVSQVQKCVMVVFQTKGRETSIFL